MEPKKIDYGTLEWFDCENNFPPIRTDLYVYSEHGYGIGRLGRRVKDQSIIWNVHLDSGEVYLVYAFYKVKRWAYMPKDEKTNTKLKHELMLNKDRSWVPCYPKSDADKVIAEQKEKLVEQVTLRTWAELQLRHQKYKRCLDKAKWCEERCRYLTCLENWQLTDKEYQQVIGGYWDRWHERWLELAEKFKVAK